MNELIFELVGPNYELASAEVFACLKGMDCAYEIEEACTGIENISTDRAPEDIGRRLGLTHRVLKKVSIDDQEDLLSGDFNIDLPEGSTAVKTRKVRGMDGESRKIKKVLGEKISETNPIDLEEPDIEVLVLIAEKCYVGTVEHMNQPSEFKDRKVKNRPFFSPISLSPRYSRALVNLSRAKEGDRIHDPFCGTGGILLEAGLLGMDVSGGDKDKEMVQGCEENLKEFDVTASLTHGDVSGTIPEDIDRIVTDPPYGRASSTKGEELEEIYGRLFSKAAESLRPGGYMAAVFPSLDHVYMGNENEELELVEHHKTRVHASLDRFFTVYKKAI